MGLHSADQLYYSGYKFGSILFQVDKDHNLMLHSNDRDELGCLKELHLNGPFGFEVVRYLLTGALDLRVLTLSIEWLDPTFCDSQPSGRKDLVGKRTICSI